MFGKLRKVLQRKLSPMVQVRQSYLEELEIQAAKYRARQSYLEELEIQAAKYLALVDVGVDEWDRYQEAMEFFTAEQEEA